jgi:hypothetical protein
MTRRIVIHHGARKVTVHPHNKSSDGLTMFVHRAATGARPFVRDAGEKHDPGTGQFTGAHGGPHHIVREKGDPRAKASEKEQRLLNSVSPSKSSGPKIDPEKLRKSQEQAAATRKLMGFGDSTGAFLRPGTHRPETRAKRTPIDAAKDALSNDPAQLRATGRTLLQYCDTSAEVREWARDEGYSRAAEAYLIEGFKQQRVKEGLSENV